MPKAEIAYRTIFFPLYCARDFSLWSGAIETKLGRDEKWDVTRVPRLYLWILCCVYQAVGFMLFLVAVGECFRGSGEAAIEALALIASQWLLSILLALAMTASVLICCWAIRLGASFVHFCSSRFKRAPY